MIVRGPTVAVNLSVPAGGLTVLCADLRIPLEKAKISPEIEEISSQPANSARSQHSTISAHRSIISQQSGGSRSVYVRAEGILHRCACSSHYMLVCVPKKACVAIVKFYAPTRCTATQSSCCDLVMMLCIAHQLIGSEQKFALCPRHSMLRPYSLLHLEKSIATLEVSH